MKTRYLALAALATLLPLGSPAQTLDVLWYAYSPTGSPSQYRENMQELANTAHTYSPAGVRWRVTFFGPGETPDFEAFDVLVVESSLVSIRDDAGVADYSGILTHSDAIAAARGSRTLITGGDPDADYLAGPPLNLADDGPTGALVNWVNWAGSGTGLGIVALDAEESLWWTADGSFLKAELTRRLHGDCCYDTYIPEAARSWPINEGLTDEGVRWFGSQTGFEIPLPGYAVVHASFGYAEEDTGTTMATASEAAGSTVPPEDYWCERLEPPLHRPLLMPYLMRAPMLVRMRLLDEHGEPVSAGDVRSAPLLTVRHGSRTQTVGPFTWHARTQRWSALLGSHFYRERGTHTVEARAGDTSYDVELCSQTITRR